MIRIGPLIAVVIASSTPRVAAADPPTPAEVEADRPASRPETERRRRAARVRRLLEDLAAREPSLPDVRAAALEHAGLDERPEQSWGRRARLAGVLPRLTLSADAGRAHDEDLTRQSTGTDRLKVATDEDVGYQARATWDLDRLVFDSAEIRAASTAQRLHRARLSLSTRVTELYYERRRLQLDALLDGGDDPLAAARRRLAIDELTARLDALTGGYFARRVRRPFDPPDEPDR